MSERARSPQRLDGLTTVILAATAFLLLGLIAPAIHIKHTGELVELLEVFAGGTQSQHSYSILGGVWQLLHGGNYFIATLIFLFSVVFPVFKLLAFWGLSRNPLASESGSQAGWVNLVEKAGKWSMLDVFVLALVLIVYQTVAGVRVSFGLGFYCFGIAILLSLYVGAVLQRRHECGPGKELSS